MNAIEIRNLCKNYPGFSLDNVSLTLPSGCIMGLVGENGAGKSTIIKLILNMIRRDGGTITLLGRDNQDVLPLTKEDIGVVLDEVGISSCLTARQVGRIMRDIYTNWDENVFEGHLSSMHLPSDLSFKKFSRGMKMKLGIAVALSHDPKLLILDEATSGLDPLARDEILDVFNEFTRDEGHSILISSHIVSDLEKVCDYIAFLSKGRLLLCEEKDVLYEEYGILRGETEKLAALPASAVIGRKISPYGAEVIVKRGEVPAGLEVQPVDIEQLFIFMVKEVG